VSVHFTLIQHRLKIFARAIKKEKYIKFERRKSKLFLFADDMILYLRKKTKDITRNHLDSINTFIM
jgi:uncharacterized protein (DUF1499 family)